MSPLHGLLFAWCAAAAAARRVAQQQLTSVELTADGRVLNVSGAARLVQPPLQASANGSLMEMGNITVKSSHYATGAVPNTHSFRVPFLEPPVVVLLPMASGEDPCNIRVTDVTATGFSAWSTEPSNEDGRHKAQVVAFVAAAAGVHKLPNGKLMEVGKLTTKKQVFARNCHPKTVPANSWETVSFAARFPSTPVLLDGLQSLNNEENAIPMEHSEPFLVAYTNGLNRNQFKTSIGRTEGGKKSIANEEIIGWIAMEPGTMSFTGLLGASVTCSAVRTGRSVRGWDNPGSPVNLQMSFSTNYPLVVGSLSSYYGNDGGWLRLKGTTANTATVVVDEDQSCDPERAHGTEIVSLLACNVPFNL